MKPDGARATQLGTELKHLLDDHNVRQVEAADAAWLSPQRLSEIIRGSKPIKKASTLRRYLEEWSRQFGFKDDEIKRLIEAWKEDSEKPYPFPPPSQPSPSATFGSKATNPPPTVVRLAKDDRLPSMGRRAVTLLREEFESDDVVPIDVLLNDILSDRRHVLVATWPSLMKKIRDQHGVVAPHGNQALLGVIDFEFRGPEVVGNQFAIVWYFVVRTKIYDRGRWSSYRLTTAEQNAVRKALTVTAYGCLEERCPGWQGVLMEVAFGRRDDKRTHHGVEPPEPRLKAKARRFRDIGREVNLPDLRLLRLHYQIPQIDPTANTFVAARDMPIGYIPRNHGSEEPSDEQLRSAMYAAYRAAARDDQKLLDAIDGAEELSTRLDAQGPPSWIGPSRA